MTKILYGVLCEEAMHNAKAISYIYGIYSTKEKAENAAKECIWVLESKIRGPYGFIKVIVERLCEGVWLGYTPDKASQFKVKYDVYIMDK